MTPPRMRPLPEHRELPPAEMRRRAAEFAEEMRGRRSVRHFSDRPVPRDLIEQCIRAAGSAPSGANLQPWHFVAVGDPALKRSIREAAEGEEHQFYTQRAPEGWLRALAPLGTDEHKPFLEIAPWLIAIFARRHDFDAAGRKVQHYYVMESVGIATGLLITAIHHAGLVCLTHTPSPMRFLNRLLARPAHEKPFLLMVVGHPAADATIPDIERKPLEEIATFLVPGKDPLA